MLKPQKHRFTQNEKAVFSVKTSVPSALLWLNDFLGASPFLRFSLCNNPLCAFAPLREVNWSLRETKNISQA